MLSWSDDWIRPDMGGDRFRWRCGLDSVSSLCQHLSTNGAAKMAERKSVKSPKSHTKAPVGRKQASLKDLPTVKAGKIVGGRETSVL